MNFVLFNAPFTKRNLLPFTFTRPISDIRVGILTIREKWEKMLPAPHSYLADHLLNSIYHACTGTNVLYANATVLRSGLIISILVNLKENQIPIIRRLLLALYGKIESMKELDDISLSWDFATDRFHDALEVMKNVFARSKKVLSKVDVDILKYIFDCTKNTERVS